MASARMGSSITACQASIELAGDEGGAGAAAVLDDLHQVAALAGGQPVGAPVVEDQQVGLHQATEQAGEPAVAMGELEFGEEPGEALVENDAVVAAGLLAEGAGEPGLADAAGSGDEQVAALLDPGAGGELLEQPLSSLRAVR